MRFTAHCLIATVILSACNFSDNTSKNASMDTVKNMPAASSEDWYRCSMVKPSPDGILTEKTASVMHGKQKIVLYT